MAETNMLITATDGVSRSMNTMRNSSKAFATDIDKLNNKLHTLSDSKNVAKLNLEPAKRSLREAQLAYEKFGNTAEEAAKKAEAQAKYLKVGQEYDKLSRELKNTTKDIRETEKALNSLSDAEAKRSNRASGGNTFGSIAGGLASAGLVNMVGGTIASGATAYAGSALSKSDSMMFDSALSGVVSGASMGAALGSIVPGLGTVAGAAIGGGVGLVTGIADGFTKQFESEDAAFISTTNALYQSRQDEKAAMLTSGSAITSEREGYKTSFSTMLGSDEKADTLLGTLKGYAAATPFGMTDLTKASKTMLAFGVEENNLMGNMQTLGDVSQGDKSRFDSLTLAYSQSKAAGKLTGQDLLQFVNAGFNPLNEIVKVTGESMDTLRKRMSDGAISFAEVEAAFKSVTSEGGQFYKGMEKQSSTFAGISSTLKDAYDDMDAAVGEGYNTLRGDGMKNQITFLQGDTGDSMREAYSAIGRHEARKENLKEEYGREAYNMVLGGGSATKMKANAFFEENSPKLIATLEKLSVEYSQASKEGDGAKLDSVMAEIKTAAENAYKSDTNTLSELDRQIDLLTDIRANTALMKDSWESQYRFDDEASKGQMSVDHSVRAKADYDTNLYRTQQIPSSIYGTHKEPSPLFGLYKEPTRLTPRETLEHSMEIKKAPGQALGNMLSPYPYQPNFPARAMGVPYVPRDNYPIFAHEGERLLTARESREYDGVGGTGVQVTVTGNEFIVREEDDILRIVNALASELRKTSLIR